MENTENEGKTSEEVYKRIPREIYDRISERVPPRKMNAWFDSGVRISGNGVVTIEAANSFILEWVKKHYRADVEAAIYGAGLGVDGVRYKINEDLRLRTGILPLEVSAEEKKLENESFVKIARRKRFAQVAVDTIYPRLKKEIIVHKGIQEAIELMNMIIKDSDSGKDPEGPILIWGENSAGKTTVLSYLIKGLFEKEVPVGYVGIKALSSALRSSYDQQTRRVIEPKYLVAARNADVVIFDEINQVVNPYTGANRPGTQSRVRDLFDLLEQTGKHVVIAHTGSYKGYLSLAEKLLSSPPDVQGAGNRDLGSRLQKAACVKIGNLESEDKRNFLGKYLLQQGVLEDHLPEVVEGIYNHLPDTASIRSIIGTARTVLWSARTNGGIIDSERVHKALNGGEQLEMLGRFARPKLAIKAIADISGISIDDLLSKRRTTEISNTRALAALVLRKEFNKSFPEIGALLGKHHSTIIQAIKRAEAAINSPDEKYAALRGLIERWKSRG